MNKQSNSGRIWLHGSAWLAVIAACILAGYSFASGTRTRLISPGAVSGTATGAGTDTCTGDGCNIGPVGIATDGGVNLCTGAGGTACTLLTGGTSGMIVNTGYVWIPSNAGIYLNLGGTRRIFDNGTNTAVNGPFSIVGGLDGVTALTNSGAAGNLPITGSASVASGKALYLNGATATRYVDHNSGNDVIEIGGAPLALESGLKLSISSPKLAVSTTAPTVSSGFGTSPSITTSNGTMAFRLNVGTGGTATNGVIGLPTATTGWNCNCADITTQSATAFLCKQSASTTTTATIGNYTTAGALGAWTASDILAVNCVAY